MTDDLKATSVREELGFQLKDNIEVLKKHKKLEKDKRSIQTNWQTGKETHITACEKVVGIKKHCSQLSEQ